ncbi:MAG: hypothetical protein QM755_24530 [Luteolibacter sp.]
MKSNNTPTAQEPEYVNCHVIAARFSMSWRHVLRLAAQGRIPSMRLGRKCVRFNIPEVDAALAKFVK